MERPVPARLTTSEGRKFGLTVGLAFGAIAGIAWWRQHPTVAIVLASLCAVLVLAGMLLPSRLGPVYRAWMGLALVISRVTTPIFLAIVYFLVIGPIGVLMRLFGKNPLRHPPEEGSYWLTRSSNRGTMSNQF